MREAPRKPVCAGCPHDLHYSESFPKRTMGVTMHLGERFCTGGKKARRFKRSDPKIYVPGWCPKRKVPCELRVFTFKSADAWWLHWQMEKSVGHSFPPTAADYALERELTTELPPREFWKRLESEPYQDLLGITLKSYSVVEIDDGLKPVFFYKTERGFKLLYSFNTEIARENKLEED